MPPLFRRRTPEPVEYCATILLRSAVARPEALAIIALVLDTPVRHPRSLRASVGLGESAWVEVELPKAGDPPPLAIDVYSTVGDEHARREAAALLALLRQSTAWNVVPDFESAP